MAESVREFFEGLESRVDGSRTAGMTNTYVFEVHNEANKIQIRKAVERLFDVKVVSVNTARVHGKFRRHGRAIARRPDWKKAYVKLQEGSAQEWKRIVDTSLPSPDDFCCQGVPLQRATYTVAPRSIVVLLRQRSVNKAETLS